MRNKCCIVLGVLAILVVGYVISIIPNFRRQAEWKQMVAVLQGLSLDRIEAGVQAFSRDRKITTSDLPATVQLRELVLAGYLCTNEIRGLESRDAAVSFYADETRQQILWIRVRWTDRHDIALMADGSVQAIRR